jgi:hypothetical protein
MRPPEQAGFFAKCGFVERGHVTYRGTPHVYYELLLGGGGRWVGGRPR